MNFHEGLLVHTTGGIDKLNCLNNHVAIFNLVDECSQQVHDILVMNGSQCTLGAVFIKICVKIIKFFTYTH